MPNTYTQVHLQIVFAVKYRQALIDRKWKNTLYKYITGIIQDYDHKVLQINGMPDHIHILIGMRPTQSLSVLIKNVKAHSSKWINENKLSDSPFAWQGGFGAFSYAKDQVPNVIKYIQNQEQHHQKQTFLEEYIEALEENEIDYNKRYLFQAPQ